LPVRAGGKPDRRVGRDENDLTYSAATAVGST
jgi:hypothetical protein